ncbi:YgfZ/GcvT domain-containing protein [Pseudomonas linyingensis]|nr:folate-binding protein YgfZ [Pseudomonas linyingensis]
MPASAFFCQLDHEGVIAVRGVDAAKFLQGQLTCNLNYLNLDTSSLGARCTPKGRMLSSFRIVPLGDGFALAMARELLEAQLADLKKYAVFFKAQLSDESAAWVRFGLSEGDGVLLTLGLDLPAQAGSVARSGALLAVRLHEGGCELWAPANEADSLRPRLAAQLREGSLNDWLLAQVRAGVGQVFGATRELFIPQMLNLQSLGGVSFKKGCYTGQEIVARMQYLGRLKRRLYRLHMDGGELPAPGAELFSPVHGSSVGEVALAARSQDGIELLAVLQDNAVEDGRLHLASIEGPALQLLELPYTIDSDRDIQH